MSGLKRFLADERAIAATEMIILAPVYLLFAIGVIYVGDYSLVTQRVVQAARFYAWKGDGSGSVGDPQSAFFSRFHGSAGVTGGTPSDFSFTNRDLDQAFTLSGASSARSLAGRESRQVVEALNGKEGVYLTESSAEVSFAYSSPSGGLSGMLLLPDRTSRSKHLVLLRSDATRSVATGPTGHQVFESFLEEIGPRPGKLRPFFGRQNAWDVDYDPTSYRSRRLPRGQEAGQWIELEEVE